MGTDLYGGATIAAIDLAVPADGGPRRLIKFETLRMWLSASLRARSAALSTSMGTGRRRFPQTAGSGIGRSGVDALETPMQVTLERGSLPLHFG